MMICQSPDLSYSGDEGSLVEGRDEVTEEVDEEEVGLEGDRVEKVDVLEGQEAVVAADLPADPVKIAAAEEVALVPPQEGRDEDNDSYNCGDTEHVHDTSYYGG